MPSALVDLERLLAPIQADRPCGDDLTDDDIWRQIKLARQQVDRDAFGSDQPVGADWGKVASLATEALTTRSKDLRLAGYLTEALVNQHGFRGLADGLQLTRGLIERYWEGVYPLPKEGDLEYRADALLLVTADNGGLRMPGQVLGAPLVPNGQQPPTLSWFQWNRRQAVRGTGEDDKTFAKRKAEADDRASKFEKYIGSTPRDYFAEQLQVLDSCRSELTALDQAMSANLHELAPGTTALREALDQCTAVTRIILKQKQGPGEAGEAPQEDGGGLSPEAAAPAGTAADNRPRGPIRTRAEALEQLREIAAFLRQSEPLSPVPYLVDRAASWMKMSLDQVLSEWIKDNNQRGQVFELLGMKAPTKEKT